jgi:hypothetical protein
MLLVAKEPLWLNVIYYPISSNENVGLFSVLTYCSKKEKKKKKKRKREREVIGLGANYVGTRGIFVSYFKI